MKAILDKLHLTAVNDGACIGPDGWLQTNGTPLTSVNPATNEPIAQVTTTTPAAYEQIVAAAQTAFASWREMPAPKRGLLVRDLGNALRAAQEPLGELVTLEMGKIRAEGIGEVQEMIDVCDFAVGLSRQLYGLTMHSERPFHRMYEQWHPLGPIGIITTFNFPVAVWSRRYVAAVAGDMMIWKPSELTLLIWPLPCSTSPTRSWPTMAPTGIFTPLWAAPTSANDSLNDPRLPPVAFYWLHSRWPSGAQPWHSGSAVPCSNWVQQCHHRRCPGRS
ncbi:MAG: aldehyde dehydrogenase family protein [Chloroflexota bacterium]